MKKVIINADDFGLIEDINRGIIQAYEEGVLTSVSLMANMLAFENAVHLLKENPNLGIGAHLNIVRGKPVLPGREVNSLINDQGYFYGFSQVLKRLLLAQFNLKEIENEFRFQIRKILDLGLHITHLDTEKHIHIFPRIFKILIGLAKEFKINKIRSFRQSLFYFINCPFSVLNVNYYKFLFLFYSSLFRQRYFSENDIKSPDYCYIIPSNTEGNLLTKTLMNTFRHLKDGVSEIICHPGYFSKELEHNYLEFGKFNIFNRESQLHLLLSSELKQIIKTMNISLINYSQF